MADHPFLFLGEGSCGYFEWASLLVLFHEPPPPAIRKRIEKGIPSPYTDSVGWEGPLLHVGSGQFINVDIATNYEADKDDEPEESDFLGLIASDSQIERFHADVETWLRKAHEQAPILCAVKPEDGEAGGTEGGTWHRWSLERLGPLFSRFLASPPTEDSYMAELLRAAIDFADEGGVPVPEALRS